MDVHVLYYMDGCFDGGLQVQNNKQLLSLQKHKVGSGLDDFRPPEVRILFSAQLCMYLRGNGALTSLCVSDWGNGGWQGDSLVYYRGGWLEFGFQHACICVCTLKEGGWDFNKPLHVCGGVTDSWQVMPFKINPLCWAVSWKWRELKSIVDLIVQDLARKSGFVFRLTAVKVDDK